MPGQNNPPSASAAFEALGCRCLVFLVRNPACAALEFGLLLSALSTRRLTHILYAVFFEPPGPSVCTLKFQGTLHCSCLWDHPDVSIVELRAHSALSNRVAWLSALIFLQPHECSLLGFLKHEEAGSGG